MPPLTVAEIKQHPEYPHVFWDLKPTKKGTSSVAQSRGGPIDIAWEVHGHGPTKLVWIMGLGAPAAAWQRQTRDFAHATPELYSSLILDNRGIGSSSAPLMRYSTSEMARDILEVLAHLSWQDTPRSLNVIGISMGGMIAQELALLAPGLIQSLCLVSTAPRVVNTVGFVENLRNRVNLFLPKGVDQQVENAKRNMYSLQYLEAEDNTEAVVERFPTNGDRFAAGEIRKREGAGFSKVGFVCQAVAAGWHHKSAEQLKELGDKVGRERIAVLHGTEDRMLTFKHGEMLLEELGGEGNGVSKYFFDGLGHVIPIEKRKEFKGIVVEMVAKGEKVNKRDGVKNFS